MANVRVSVKYTEELVKTIQELFINYIVPENFLLTVHSFNTNVLTIADIERLRKISDSKSRKEANYELLTTIKNYEGWFEVILKVCCDYDVKQAFLAKEFERIKSEVDKKWILHLDQKETQSSTLIENDYLLLSDVEKLSLTTKKGMDADGGVICSPLTNLSDVEVRRKLFMDTDNRGEELKPSSGVAMSIEEKNNNSSNINSGSLCADTATNLNDNWMRECEICDVKFTSETNYTQHMDGKPHKKKVEALLKYKTSVGPSEETVSFEMTPDKGKIINVGVEVASNSGRIGPSSIINRELLRKPLSEFKFNATNYWIQYCEVCDLHFTSAEHSKQHMEGKPHEKKVKALNTKPLMTPPPKLGPNREVHVYEEHGRKTCFLCNVTFTSREHANHHLSGRKHKNLCKENGLPIN